MTIKLPPVICFRVTRHCNARCSFCLAPPDGINTPVGVLKERVNWLMAHGVSTVHFCGGEPSIHPELPGLIGHVHMLGGKSKITTNGINISDALRAMLRKMRTQVKISLHGDRDHHNMMVGRDAFDLTTQHARDLVKDGVPVSIQTTVVAGHEWVVDWVSRFCLENGVRRMSILPFIPRGSGISRRDDFGLSTSVRQDLRLRISQLRRLLNTRLDVRWLDFTARPFHVVEPDGRILIEGATEALDEVVGHIPHIGLNASSL